MSTLQPSRLFVGGLHYDVTDADLAQHFDPSGRVTRATIVIDRDTGRSRGFGFVQFVSPLDAENARRDLDGSELYGRRIAVKVAEEPCVVSSRASHGSAFRIVRGRAPRQTSVKKWRIVNERKRAKATRMTTSTPSPAAPTPQAPTMTGDASMDPDVREQGPGDDRHAQARDGRAEVENSAPVVPCPAGAWP